jgi:hypothetical protein
MYGRWTPAIPLLLAASVTCASSLAAQAPANACSLATSEEFQRAHGVNPAIGILPSAPEYTEVRWGQHCDYPQGAIDLFTSSAELERLLVLVKAPKERSPVPGLGKRAFFTVANPGDQYSERGFLVIDTGAKLVAISMDPDQQEPVSATRPKLEGLAKLVLPRLK